MKPSDLPPLSEEAKELLEVARRTNGPPVEVQGRMLHRLKAAVGMPLTPGDGGATGSTGGAGAAGATTTSAGAGGAGAAAGSSLASLFKPAVLVALGATGLAAVVTTAVVVSRSPESSPPAMKRSKDESFAPGTVAPSQRGVGAPDETSPATVPSPATRQDRAASADHQHAPELTPPTRAGQSKRSRFRQQRTRQQRARQQRARRARIKQQRARRAWIKQQRAKRAKLAMTPAPPEAASAKQPETEPTQQQEPAELDTEPVRPLPPSTLKAERALIEPARRALKKNKPSRALKLVEKHRNLYADGQLSEERELISIRALVLLGKKGQARDAAQLFLRRYPKSLLRPLVDTILRKQL